jgi:hypothetical protein
METGYATIVGEANECSDVMLTNGVGEGVGGGVGKGGGGVIALGVGFGVYKKCELTQSEC